MLIILGLGTGIYATLDFLKYPLLASTLINNCGAMHLINNKDLLKPNLFIKSSINKSVKAGLSALPIIGRGTRVIRRALNGELGIVTADLILKDVAIIKGFYINIISEAYLLELGV
jgi:hypothetical protein